MRVTFGEIDKSGSRFSVEKGEWSDLDETGVSIQDIKIAEVVARSRDAESIDLTGKLAATVRMGCARCGEPVDCIIDEEFYYLVTMQEESIAGITEKECSNEECDILYLREPVVDIDEIFREQLFLAVPQKVLCSSDCSGICPDCGLPKNSAECNCSEDRTNSPFAILKTLKKD
ncbi:DUF177 domain-containing protein [Desulfopila sp. IMCC35008]|uniref:YceD family protein n=1 Tax=Desulfopila sp. IMCC35008 TaxID=2653858 RepID=UPI0013D8C4C0|nr:DUF177 domain-containing protein [Desulfopila sp. IMCC35008]